MRVSSSLLAFAVAIMAAATPSSAASDANGFAAKVCALFPRASGSITAWRGLGCSWNHVDGKALQSDEAITITAHRNASATQIAAYRQVAEGYIDGMAQYGLARITTVSHCARGTGRKAIITASPELLMVSGYMVCGSHYISADIKLRPGTGIDPSRLFDDLMPGVLPVIG